MGIRLAITQYWLTVIRHHTRVFTTGVNWTCGDKELQLRLPLSTQLTTLKTRPAIGRKSLRFLPTPSQMVMT